ncbi:MAG TPA: hypothetical protein ENK15_01850 [Thermopetrobacter sp.]|nr:hypothetical protein [Thermopetrobacter sp.]
MGMQTDEKQPMNERVTTGGGDGWTVADGAPCTPPIGDAPPEGPGRFLNRELSWLSFNMRVLEESANPAHPLLERLRFLSISGNNLDEFFMVRVAGLVGQVREGISTVSQDGLTPAAQLEKVHAFADRLMRQQDERWAALKAELAEENIHIVTADDLTEADGKWLDTLFLGAILPAVTPVAIDPAHPFPFIPNRGFVIAARLRGKRDRHVMTALLPVPQQLERFIRLPERGRRRRIRSRSSPTAASSSPPGCAASATGT